MTLSLDRFPDGTHVALHNGCIMLYGKSGDEWARIIQEDGKLYAYPTWDIPMESLQILNEICDATK